jgi:hypothetical protein
VKDYFTPKAIMKLTLWKDNQRNELKLFGQLPILQIIRFDSIIYSNIRDRLPYPPAVFSRHHAMRCQVHEALIRRRTRAIAVPTPCGSGVCCSCLDIPVHQWVHRHPPWPTNRPRSHHPSRKHGPLTVTVILVQIRPPAIRSELP